MSRADRFLNACRRRPVDTTPVWLMRQAGRYMSEYQQVRAKAGGFLDLCKTPELACEVTLQPIRAFGVDAAILFSDILVPCEAMGQGLTYPSGGPRLEPAIRDRAGVDALQEIDAATDCDFVLETVRRVRASLDGEVPLIGFAGAPWTTACYMVEGQATKSFIEIKKMIFGDPETAHLLLQRISAALIDYMTEQVRAGAQALQLFDTWAEALSPRDFKTFALTYARRVFDGVRAALEADGLEGDTMPPFIYFARGANGYLEMLADSGADVLGIDWRIDLAEARRRLGPEMAVQGNLDPTALFLPPEQIEKRVVEVLEAGAGAPGHVFNLGHGVLPPTDRVHVQALVDAVHRHGVGVSS